MFTADKIDDRGLWLGDINALENIEALDKHKISHILTILDYKPTHIDKKRTHLYIQAEDLQSTDLLTNEFEKCFQFIDKAIQQGDQVLVHCQKGISRSATIAAMYLMRKYSLTREQALEKLKTQRRYSLVMPNDGFLRQLDIFHQMNYVVNVENELYKDFQRNRFNITESKSKLDSPRIVLLDTKNEQDYKCRACQFSLFNTNEIQKHEKQLDTICNDNTRIFTYFLDWIDEIFVNPVGKICCPNCKTILGEYSLQGIQCNCHQWIKPAFIFHYELIE